jgi:carotenoid 1,2-hydratase
VFSPYYARARRRNAFAAPEDHCALNVALYGRGARRWTMTERGKGDLTQATQGLLIGSSSLSSDGSSVVIDIAEKTALFGAEVTGRVVVKPITVTNFESLLDENGRHQWTPIAPRVHVEVTLKRPALTWSGTGYLDMNRGSEPLEDGFVYWNWSRANLKNGTAILYDVTRREGGAKSLDLSITSDGRVSPANLPRGVHLLRTRIWQMPRETRCDAGGRAKVYRTLEDTPFYSRSMIETVIGGEKALAMHESLSLNRFRTRIVQSLLPYRMPRIAKDE